MSFRDFSSQLWVRTWDSSSVMRMGSFQVASDLELTYIRVLFLMRNVSARGGSEKIRTIVYSDSGYSNALYTSGWSSINTTNISALADSHSWIGYVRTDFSTRYNINSAITYYLGCEIASYTRSADTYYCALSYDFPHAIYDNAQDLFQNRPLAMQIFGYQARS